MAKFHSLEEVENRIKHELIPQTDLDKNVIMDSIRNKKNNKKIVKPQLILTALVVLIIGMPILSNGKISYSQTIKNIEKSIYGIVVKYIEETEDDGGYQLIEKETSEEENKSNGYHFKVMNSNEMRELSQKIRKQLEPGEVAMIVVNGGHNSLVSIPIVFNDIESIKDYGLDISFPEYLPDGYEFEEGTLSFSTTDDSRRDSALRKEVEDKNLPYLWVKMEDSMMHTLCLKYRSSRKTISVSIRLSSYPSANQSIVEKDSNYDVEILNIGDKEVMHWNRGSSDIIDTYTFKIPNREYKTYDIEIFKSSDLPFEELEKMIESFK